MQECITDDIEFSSDNSDREDSNEENSDAENSNIKIKYRMCLFFIIKAFRVILSYL